MATDSTITKSQVRPWPLNASDPLGVLVAGVFLAVASAGAFSAIGWTADQVASFQAGLLMVAASVRWYLEQRNTSAVMTKTTQIEAKAFSAGLMTAVPEPRVRVGAPGEGGTVEVPGDDKTPVEDDTIVVRRG